jgi:chemotaxis protein histidine kinase CheA
MPRHAKTKKKSPKNKTLGETTDDMDLKDLFSLFKKLKRNVEKKAEERKGELKRKAANDARKEVERKLNQVSRVRIQRLESVRDDVRGLVQQLTKIKAELCENEKNLDIKTKAPSFEKKIRKEASEVMKGVQMKWDARFGESTKTKRHEEVQKRIHHFLRDLHDSLMRSKTGFETLRSELRRGVRRLSDHQ